MKIRIIIGVVAGLALLTWAASFAVETTTWGWFEKDMTLRAQLAVSVGRHSLIDRWHLPGPGLTGLLGAPGRIALWPGGEVHLSRAAVATAEQSLG